MLLQTDEQTIEDLRLFSKRDQPGIYEIYNNTCTRGGESLLQQMFRHPLSDAEAITQRISIIAAFARLAIPFPFDAGTLDIAEKYLSDAEDNASQKSVMGDKEISNGVAAVITLLQQVKHFAIDGDLKQIAGLEKERSRLLSILGTAAMLPVFNEQAKARLSYAAVTAYDLLFRQKEKQTLREVLHFIYQLDACISVAQVAVKRKFIFPLVHAKGTNLLKIEGVYHPALKDPVVNSLTLNSSKTIVFLTGANMAGKSTFLRSFSTALYIAHMGFPVAASAMEFSVMDGIYTTINLPDNLGIGASHFYAEVLRLKKIATELSLGKNLFVLFDELFRGTNVKDAEEGTVAVTHAFAGKTSSMFIISSHIVEAAAALSQKSNIGFHYLPTVMNGTHPQYTYKLEEGITSDRHGMLIIRNEGILETLKHGKKE
ncbi:DNA mismatch repair protein [Pseudoflavitalea sp. G-6-1-2]|uniref:MutS-related protein n=1 Tax=Pseudoflavitalea sp. G-6-1-2 TaxID=2728841 RepID=UPI00146CB761|nr:DNA mismatch repair protein [Pseudoflavitalea sp. G-6-1-2]NML22395.1 DNA mismatch repair protein [Pseudoflavitalea sp. G-6-1-2]